MNKFAVALAASLVSLAAVPAFAQEATYDYPQPVASAVTRAQVQAELQQARRDGSIRVWSTSYNHIAAAKSLKTRDEVRAETLAAGAGYSAALTGEDSGSFAMSRQPGAQPAAALYAAR